MKTLSLAGVAVMLLAITAQVHAVSIDGYCILRNQQNHEGSQVLFEAASGGVENDTTYTDSTGYFLIEINFGYYNVYYTHQGYCEHLISHRPLLSNETLQSVTLNENWSIQISGNLSGALGPATYQIVDNISVQSQDSLVLMPGTVFLFDGDFDFDIFGYLYAAGAVSDRIYFLPYQGVDCWQSLNFRAGSSHDSFLEYCHIAGASGTAINVYSTDITISNCDIMNNEGTWGGGIYCSECCPTIIDCYIAINHATQAGGGIYCTNAEPEIVNCALCNNSTEWMGGGIACNLSSSPTIRKCTITHNLSNQAGGGIGLVDNSDPRIIQCAIYSNISNGLGGGISCITSSDAIITNCTISRNIAYSYGGGLYVGQSNPIITNTIFWGDSTSLGASEIHDLPQVTYSDVQGGFSGEGNIDIDPLFRNPQFGDFHLQDSIECGDPHYSPCVDVGNPNILDNLLDCDWGLGMALSDMGAFGGGDSASAVIPKKKDNIPAHFRLFQNHPNPFNPTTIIPFELPHTTHVTVTVYNVMGRKIATLLDRILNHGHHTVHFDASHLSPGIYFYQVQADNFTETKKMVLLK
jgi:hypothetical protein